MRKGLLAIAAATLFAWQATPAQYDYTTPGMPARGTFAFHVAPELAIPLADFGDVQGIGVGGVGGVEYALTDGVVASLTAGYLWFSGKDFTVGGVDVEGESGYAIPVVVGTKYYLLPGLHIGAEAGWHRFGNGGTSDEFSVAPVAGYDLMMGATALALSAQYVIAGDFDYVGIRAGFRFGGM